MPWSRWKEAKGRKDVKMSLGSRNVGKVDILTVRQREDDAERGRDR